MVKNYQHYLYKNVLMQKPNAVQNITSASTKMSTNYNDPQNQLPCHTFMNNTTSREK